MRLLLDTNALLWWLSDSPRLGAVAREMIADHASEVLVSVVSLWEIAIKARIGKLQADLGEIEGQIELEGFRRVAITPAHFQALMSLPQHHRDPFDHLLMAQAIAEEAMVVTSDRRMTDYPVPLAFAD